jgi:hypothetical protein
MKIETSLDWGPAREDLMTQIQSLSYNSDLRKMLRALDDMVSKLSQMEVESRRTKNNTKSTERIAQINKSIENLEQWITMAMLME